MGKTEIKIKCNKKKRDLMESRETVSQNQMQQMMIARHTASVYERLRDAHVAIAGLGGLGSHIAIELARAGVGHLHLVDFDQVDLSNLNRQCYGIFQLGKYKTEALTEEIQEINPYLSVTQDCIRVTEENAEEIFGSFPIVCEAFDDPKAKAMLVNILLAKCPELYLIAASGMAGWESSNQIQTVKISDHFYLCGDRKNGIRKDRGLMAPRVSICAGHQANMVLRLILGEREV